MARTREREDGDRGSKKRFKYRGYESGDVKKAANTQSGDFDNYLTVPGFKPKEGENSVRILPRSWDDTDAHGSHWGMPIMVHYRLGNEGSTYLCLKSSGNAESCPACDAAAAADDEGEAKKLRAKKRILCYVIDRSDEKAGPQPWSMPVTLYKEINARIEKVSTKIGDVKVDHPDDGYDISFTREGTDEHTKYTGVDIERDSTPLNESDKKAAKWMAHLDDNPLPDLLQHYDEDHLEKILSGGGKRRKDDDDEEDDDEPKAKKGKGKSKSKKSDDDDEEDDEDEADDEDTPKRKKPKGKKSDDDDDEDDNSEEDEEEDNDDEPKAKKGKGKAKRRDDDDDEEDEDDEDEPKAKKGKGKSCRSDDDDEEDEVEEEVEDDEDDDDEPKAKKGKGKSKSKKSDDDDEEDDEDEADEEDDDDEPKAKGGNASSRAKKRLESLKRRRGGK